MFDYKDAHFFSEYFKNHPDFKLLDEFKKSEEDDEKDENLYVGSVEVLNTIYPLVLRVEIPVTFPHHHLLFRTKSLSGYPHLIHNGKVQYGDWFCLNTPFAETVEEQLNQEVARLKQWIIRQMRPDLPPIIKDSNVRKAIAFANAYDWENPDEVNEFSKDAMLTFVGDFYCFAKNFKERVGYLNCIKSPDKRFYALNNSELTNHKLPYIIVDEAPKSPEIFADFLRLKEQYEWDEKTCKHLLPDFEFCSNWTPGCHTLGNIDEKEALSQLKEAEMELSKDSPSLQIFSEIFHQKKRSHIKYSSAWNTILMQELAKIKISIENHEFKSHFSSFRIPNYDNMSEEEIREQERRDQEEEYYREVYPYEWHSFAFGIKQNDNIFWNIVFTNHSNAKYERVWVDFKFTEVELKKLYSHHLNRLSVQAISDDMYFGRGAFSSRLRSKNIAIVGLGAIGSMVAESMAHSGVSRIGLWDSDIVEPGNICRSAYSLRDIGESKVLAIEKKIKSINPFIKTDDIKGHGFWLYNDIVGNESNYVNGSFYDNVNYKNQEESIKEIKGFDLIIDCTGSNEILHFLSYAVPDTEIVSLCITNHANELLCVSSNDGNPFELRKAYLSRLEQDTKNFYVEGSGCYSPTFLATNSDIASLVNLFLREINKRIENNSRMHSVIFSHTERGVLADRMLTYKLAGYDIILNVTNESLLDAEELDDVIEGNIGYILGAYSKDGKQIMITHIVDAFNAEDMLKDAFILSKCIIDYIGDFAYSGATENSYRKENLAIIADKAYDETINTNNPLLAVRNPSGTISFFLFINNELVPFEKQED